MRTDLVGIAKTQVGYTESVHNFEVGSDGVRRGYTRYGAWYGVPYSDWSTIFVSYCLHYAGADPEEYPSNTGATTMAGLWKKRGNYVPVGQYHPVSGDLVFFADNTVGIISQVYSTTLYAIRGDVDNVVRGSLVPLADASIVGWGVTGSLTSGIVQPSTSNPGNVLLDVSNGPAVFISEGTQMLPTQIETYTTTSTSTASTQTIVDLIPYLEANGGHYFFTLLDKNNQELPKDANGNYIAQANTNYKLTITFVSPEGFLPGTYQHQIPNGLLVDGGAGSFVLKDGTNVGEWEVTDTGLITLVFNEHMNSRSDITISATMGIHFPEQDEDIDFDGQITVTVEKPPPQDFPTELYKWGVQGNPTNGTDPSKFYWTVNVIGHQDSQIPGNILSDEILYGQWSKAHHFTESDIAGGLTFGASENGKWHSWHVSADDPHLIWTETGWSYKMPKTVTCDTCGELELGNDGWIYYINYTSTPDPLGIPGTFGYENIATIDGKNAYAWTDFTHGEASGEIIKNGSFVSDAGGGAFVWEFQATIPGKKDGQFADYHWYIMDYMYLVDNYDSHAGYVENDANLAVVTASYNGNTILVPNIRDATENDLFAWDNAWSSVNNGINYGREFNLMCRCICDETNCPWGSGCSEYWVQQPDGNWIQNGFCQCWTVPENVTFTFIYTTEDMSTIESFGGMDYKVQNIVELYYKPDRTDAGGALVSSSDAIVPIPGVFKKELTHDFDGYTAHYKVSINESKLVLTNGAPLNIHDEMTKTLAYISGSLIITSEDANGNTATLQQGVDYTVTYDGTGNHTDENGNEVHVLDIVILHPQPVMYVLDYDATLIMPEVITGGVKYTNSANITLWGTSIGDSTSEKVYADINIAAKDYKVKMFKTCAETNKPLAGATFGLYNDHGGLITTEVTDSNGELLFHTNLTEGVVLREHLLYYIQELQAPPGYQLDDTKYWICFCGDETEHCDECAQILATTDAARIPFEEVGKVHITNNILNYDLPATGGFGTYPLILVSVILVVTPLVYGNIQRRKRERRGDG